VRLTILGSGTSSSHVPGIPNRYPPAFLVEWDNETILFDCSEGVRFRLEQVGVLYADIHHIVMSHAHPDHNVLVNYIHSIANRNGMVEEKNTSLDIYAPQQIVDDFPAVWKGYVPDDPERKSDVWPKLIFHVMSGESKRACSIGSGTLTGFEAFHGFGNTDAISLRLETAEGLFAYSGDTGDCPGIRQACIETDIFVCEAAARIGDFAGARAYGHLTPYQAGEIAKDGKVKKLILFHYSGAESEEKIIEDCKSSGFAGEILCAGDFDVFEVNMSAIEAP
jgi:ribonuclease BN (tRNA processing enzyme)